MFQLLVSWVENNPRLWLGVEENPQKCENWERVEDFPPSLYGMIRSLARRSKGISSGEISTKGNDKSLNSDF